MSYERAVSVASLGRSGTTMAVAMLEAGGLSPVVPWPYESWTAMATRPGQVVKWIDPHRAEVYPVGYPFGGVPGVVVWMSRSPEQVARSQIKFIRTLDQTVSIRRSAIPRLIESIVKEQEQALSRIIRMGLSVVMVRFEDVLSDPQREAGLMAMRLRGMVGRLDTSAMASVVIRRSPECAPDLAVEAAGRP